MSIYEKIGSIYLIMVNVITFAVFGIDKYKAIRKKYRIPEKTLFLLAGIGGSIGALAGMIAFRHKTAKWYFKIGIPVILVVQIVLVLWILFY